jgi:hypothetical protein
MIYFSVPKKSKIGEKINPNPFHINQKENKKFENESKPITNLFLKESAPKFGID